MSRRPAAVPDCLKHCAVRIAVSGYLFAMGAAYAEVEMKGKRCAIVVVGFGKLSANPTI